MFPFLNQPAREDRSVWSVSELTAYIREMFELDYRLQEIEVTGEIVSRVAAGERRITGVMIESHLEEGRQDLEPGQRLLPGVSITDACISWEQTAPLLQALAVAVRQRRQIC